MDAKGWVELVFKFFAWPVTMAVTVVVLVVLLRKYIPDLVARLTELGILKFRPPTASPASQPSVKELAEETPATTPTKNQLTLSPILPQVVPLVRDIEAKLKELNLPKDQEREHLVRALAETQLTSNYARSARDVFGSQLTLLTQANQFGSVPILTAQEIYKQASKANPALYKGFPFAQWLRFLTERHFIESDGTHVTVTDDGRLFMKFLVDTRDTGFRPN